MRAKAYVETSVISYLTARPSRNTVVAGRQVVTQQWWDARQRFDLYVSQLVVAESAAGDRTAAAARLAAMEGIPLLELDQATGLADLLVATGSVPAKAYSDAVHVAAAAANGMHYLVTWNCAHIANATLMSRIEEVCREAGFEPARLCTPDQLLHDPTDDT